MARKEDIEADIALELDGAVDPTQLARALNALHGLLKKGQGLLHPDKTIKPIRWQVQVKEGSSVVEFHPTGDQARQKIASEVIDHVGHSLKTLDEGQKRFEPLDDAMLGHLQTLSRIGTGKGDHPSLRLWFRGQGTAMTFVHITPRTEKNLAAFRGGGAAEFEEYGDVRGRLEVLNAHNPKSPTAIVHGPFYDKGVKCLFGEGKLFEQARELFTRRVHIEGPIKHKAGMPYEVRVRHLRALPEESELPDYRTTRGILKGYV